MLYTTPYTVYRTAFYKAYGNLHLRRPSAAGVRGVAQSVLDRIYHSTSTVHARPIDPGMCDARKQKPYGVPYLKVTLLARCGLALSGLDKTPRRSKVFSVEFDWH
jgi:hypothetical protein